MYIWGELGILESDKQVIQYKRKMIEDAHNQRWYYREDGFIYPQTDPNLVLDIRVSISIKFNSVELIVWNEREIGLNQELLCCSMNANMRTIWTNYGIWYLMNHQTRLIPQAIQIHPLKKTMMMQAMDLAQQLTHYK